MGKWLAMSKALLNELLNEVKELRAELKEIKDSEFFKRKSSKISGAVRGYVFDGLPLREWLKAHNVDVSVNMVHNRLYRGWTLKEAIEIPKGDLRFERRRRKVEEYHSKRHGIVIHGGKNAHITSTGGALPRGKTLSTRARACLMGARRGLMILSQKLRKAKQCTSY